MAKTVKPVEQIKTTLHQVEQAMTTTVHQVKTFMATTVHRVAKGKRTTAHLSKSKFYSATFMGVPVEIRKNILHYVFVANCAIRREPLMIRWDVDHMRSRGAIDDGGRWGQKEMNNIMRVSRQVYEESKDVLYRGEFEFFVCLEPKYAKQWLKQLGMSKTLIRRLHLKKLAHGVLTDMIGGDGGEIRWFCWDGIGEMEMKGYSMLQEETTGVLGVTLEIHSYDERRKPLFQTHQPSHKSLDFFRAQLDRLLSFFRIARLVVAPRARASPVRDALVKMIETHYTWSEGRKTEVARRVDRSGENDSV